jgi:hypothetical protein
VREHYHPHDGDGAAPEEKPTEKQPTKPNTEVH